MAVRALALDPDPTLALRAIRAASSTRPVLVFKHSPICPVSHHAEAELETFLEERGDPLELALARIDVIAERALARGLTALLGVRHESPQALWFEQGELAWHGSHGALTHERFAQLVERGRSPA